MSNKVHTTRYLYLSTTLILLLAFMLRAYGLDAQNIWGDEAFSIHLGAQPLPEALTGADTHPAFYPAALWAWMPFVGKSAYAVRYLSLLFGVLMVGGVLVLGRRVGGPRVMALAGLLAAVSPFAVYYSQEARMYAPVAAFGVLATYALLRLLDADIRSWRWPTIYWAAALGMIYSHYYAFFLLAAHNLAVLILWRRLGKRFGAWVGMQAALALAFAPWVPFLLAQGGVQSSHATGGWMGAWGLEGLRTVWQRTYTAFTVGTTAPYELTQWALLGLIIVAAGMHAAIKMKFPGHRAVLLTALLIPPLLAHLALPATPFFYERYLISMLPVFLVVLALGVDALRDATPILSMAAAALLLLAPLPGLNRHYHDPAVVKGRYGDMTAYIEQHATDDAVLLLNNRLQGDLYNYYRIEGMPVYWYPPLTGWGEAGWQDTALSQIEGHDQVWVVMFGNPLEYDGTRNLISFVGEHAYQAYRGGWVDGDLYLFVTGEVEPDQDVAAVYGDMIRLNRAGISSTTPIRGDTIQVAVEWEAVAAPDRDYTVFLHLIDARETIYAQVDSQPAGGARPTSTWTTADPFIDRYALQLPPDLLPGIYYVQIGWYDWQTLDRLPVVSADGEPFGERVIIAEVEVSAR